MNTQLERGQQIAAGRYQLIEMIDAGGQAQIWRAKSISLNKEVAVKITITPASEYRLLERRRQIFNHEKEISNHLHQHENIVKIHDFIDEMASIKNEKFHLIGIVMEYVSAGDLQRRIRNDHRSLISNKKAFIAFLHAICSVVNYSHIKGVIHCDLKPENILLVDRSGEVIPKLMDFGVSLCKESNTTFPISQGGTPEFMAPELFQGEQCDEASDIYALGILFFEICFGRKPYLPLTTADLNQKYTYYEVIHREKKFDMANQNEESRIPERVRRLVSEMFFERRHSTLKTVISELESILNDLIYRSLSSGGSENFPFPEKIRWAPELHQKLGKTLFYILFKGQNPKGDLEALSKSLRDQRLGNFCCYQVIGRYDYIIRLWASPIFRDNIKQAIEMLMPADWTYYEFEHVAALNDCKTGQIKMEGDRIQIIKEIALIVSDSHGDFQSALKKMIERKFAHGSISSYQTRVGFFTLIQLIRGDRAPLNEDAFKMLRDDFFDKFKRECKGVKNLSLCSDKDRGIILIKYTLGRYKNIGPIMKMLVNFADSHHRSFHTKTSLETFVMIPDFPPILNDDGAIPFLVSTELSSHK